MIKERNNKEWSAIDECEEHGTKLTRDNQSWPVPILYTAINTVTVPNSDITHLRPTRLRDFDYFLHPEIGVSAGCTTNTVWLVGQSHMHGSSIHIRVDSLQMEHCSFSTTENGVCKKKEWNESKTNHSFYAHFLRCPHHSACYLSSISNQDFVKGLCHFRGCCSRSSTAEQPLECMSDHHNIPATGARPPR